MTSWANLRPWRVGRKVGRTIYAVVADEPSDTDVLIGMMDSRALAAEAVGAHNGRLQFSTSDARLTVGQRREGESRSQGQRAPDRGDSH